MFKLYVDNCGWEKIGISQSEGEIVSTMIGYTNQFATYHFLIINHIDEINSDVPYKRISNEEEFKEYLLDCKERSIELVSKKKKKKKKKEEETGKKKQKKITKRE